MGKNIKWTPFSECAMKSSSFAMNYCWISQMYSVLPNVSPYRVLHYFSHFSNFSSPELWRGSQIRDSAWFLGACFAWMVSTQICIVRSCAIMWFCLWELKMGLSDLRLLVKKMYFPLLAACLNFPLAKWGVYPHCSKD